MSEKKVLKKNSSGFCRAARFSALLPAVILVLSLCGCSAPGFSGSVSEDIPEDTSPVTQEVFAMDTHMTLTAYGDAAQDAVSEASDRLYRLDRDLSASDESSQIYALNHRLSDHVSGDTAAVLSASVRLAGLTENYFDISVYPLVCAWGFPTKEYRVPSGEEIGSLLSHTGMDGISFDETTGTVTFADERMMIDTGAVAKGYASDVVAGIFREYGISSGLISLGGNICAFGSKTDGSDWNIAVQDPFRPSDPDAYAGIVSCSDTFLITSGSYQRYFTEDGKRYCHIIDPFTGYPADNGLMSVTVVSSSGTEGDALSTALYVMGLEKASEFWKNCDEADFEAIFVTDDRKVYVTEGIADSFQSSFGTPQVISRG